MGDEVLGCRIRYNETTLGKTSTPYSLECTISWVVDSVSDINRALNETLFMLNKWLSLELKPIELPRWEYLGRRFNLYVYKVGNGKNLSGEIRLVETGSNLLCIAGVFSRQLGRYLGESLLGELKLKKTIEYGYNISIFFLERPPSVELESQKPIPNFIVYTAEGGQEQDVGSTVWTLKISGEVQVEKEYSIEQLSELAEDYGPADFHCVTGWSVLRRKWEGVSLSKLLSEAKPTSRAKWLVAKSAKGYSSIIPLEEVFAGNPIAVLRVDKKPLTREHGFPLRLFFPRLFGWKSVKWVSELLVLGEYEDGTWEARAYHERGLVEYEERFKVRNPSIVEEGQLTGRPRPLKP